MSFARRFRLALRTDGFPRRGGGSAGSSLRPLWVAFLLVNGYVYVDLSLGTPICLDDCLGYVALMGKSFPGTSGISGRRARW